MLLLLACDAPAPPAPEDSPAPGDTAPEVVPDPPDTGDTAAGDTASGHTAETGDASADSPAPPVLGHPSMLPEGGGFVKGVEVTLSVEDGEGALTWCFAEPAATGCTFQPYEAPIRVESSGILRAQVTLDHQVSAVVARAFVALQPGLASFRSDVPVLLFATPGDGPSGSADVPMSMVVLEPRKKGELALRDAAVNTGRARLHVRGSSSAGHPKQSWDLELWESDSDADRNDALLGMPDNGDWILYAPYGYDLGLIRNPLAFAIAERLGRYAPRARFAEVFLAGGGVALGQEHYQGLYVLMEEVERHPDRVNLVALEPDDVAEPEVTGGYLFKVDRTGDGESGLPSQTGTAGGRFDFQQPFVLVDPEEDEVAREQWRYLIDRLDSLGNALAAADGVDPATGQHWDDIADVDAFIDHHIVNLVMKNPDALRLSSYLYQDRGGEVTAGPVWDFDRAAGSADSRSADPTWWDAQNVTSDCTDMFAFGWYEAWFDDPVFAERYWGRLSALLDAELSTAELEGLVDGTAAGLDAAAARDAARWSQPDFRTEVDALRAWLLRRRAWMRACIDTWPDPRDCPG